MAIPKHPLLGAVLCAALCGTASADSQWQTVSLDGGVSIDVPQTVGADYKPSAKAAKGGDLMYFKVTSRSDGELTCLLGRNAYGKGLGRADVAKRLADSRRDALCSATEGETKLEVGESESLSVGGYPAGRCAASYTAAAEKQPGQVAAVMGVAAPDGFYILSCTLYESSQDEAVSEWMVGWNDDVHHIQQSLNFRAR